MTFAPVLVEPQLPDPCGPLSMTAIELLRERAPHRHLTRIESSLGDADPLGQDLQLTLYVCYELHYRGFAGVDPRWEWDPALLDLRRRMEENFLSAVRAELGEIPPDQTVSGEVERLDSASQAGGLSTYLQTTASWTEMREYFVHRSVYHQKEGDPHAWLIPRLTGQAKASFVAVEFDEFGAGRGARVHQQLFTDLLTAAGLDATYLGHLDVVAAESLAAVNLMSMFGLHRGLRGAAVGHFAATEIVSSPGSRRIAKALKRLGAPRECVDFYREHVEADAVHEQVVRADVIGDLLAREPHLGSDVVFGIRAFELVEERLANHMLDRWSQDQSSLRRPLD